MIPLSSAVVERTVAVRRAHRLKLPDAVIVATALEFDFDLMTNDQQLSKAPGLRCRPVSLKPL
ncbi:PIN domain-containing protein [Fimbriimonas ginsengisoli]|uniref:PIN domain-containing protein n=1 Tax=Fimbriimonas ginsengisoli TaxID=1005039 RepID=UPI0009FF6B8A